MSDLYDLLGLTPSHSNDASSNDYLARLSTLSFDELTSTEPASLLHAAQSHLRNLQALSRRSHKAVIASTSCLSNLSTLLPGLQSQASELREEIPSLENAATDFANKYDRSKDNAALDRRKRALLLSRNVDRVSDILELPSLLSSTVIAAQAPGSASSASSANSYTSALDINAHVKRLRTLYPHSELVGSVASQSDAEINNLITILITSLQSPTLKLAAAIRTIGWLRRVAPDLADNGRTTTKPSALSIKSIDLTPAAAQEDGALGSLFLVCRLRTLHVMLDALEPLRELADQESERRRQTLNGATPKQRVQSGTNGSQSERYLKRYVEIFREQSFAIISMYKSIFPSGLPTPETNADSPPEAPSDPLLPLPSPINSFSLHLASMLMATLREYLPNVTDKSARESLLMQVLYCAGSLGRLGADFGMMIAQLESDLGADATPEPEWVQVMHKHRIQASRLEALARGVGSATRKGSTDLLTSPTAVSAG